MLQTDRKIVSEQTVIILQCSCKSAPIKREIRSQGYHWEIYTRKLSRYYNGHGEGKKTYRIHYYKPKQGLLLLKQDIYIYPIYNIFIRNINDINCIDFFHAEWNFWAQSFMFTNLIRHLFRRTLKSHILLIKR